MNFTTTAAINNSATTTAMISATMSDSECEEIINTFDHSIKNTTEQINAYNSCVEEQTELSPYPVIIGGGVIVIMLIGLMIGMFNLYKKLD